MQTLFRTSVVNIIVELGDWRKKSTIWSTLSREKTIRYTLTLYIPHTKENQKKTQTTKQNI